MAATEEVRRDFGAAGFTAAPGARPRRRPIWRSTPARRRRPAATAGRCGAATGHRPRTPGRHRRGGGRRAPRSDRLHSCAIRSWHLPLGWRVGGRVAGRSKIPAAAAGRVLRSRRAGGRKADPAARCRRGTLAAFGSVISCCQNRAALPPGAPEHSLRGVQKIHAADREIPRRTAQCGGPATRRPGPAPCYKGRTGSPPPTRTHVGGRAPAAADGRGRPHDDAARVPRVPRQGRRALTGRACP